MKRKYGVKVGPIKVDYVKEAAAPLITKVCEVVTIQRDLDKKDGRILRTHTRADGEDVISAYDRDGVKI